ncbi:rCG62705 [Rattus norvegicus]|uniref:RCG62705 n=1 Tax=Rattus norvegicus TaxID=10116 RepID=A6J5P7_RAT|nr:rCG62705 [Rattus norvegicus]
MCATETTQWNYAGHLSSIMQVSALNSGCCGVGSPVFIFHCPPQSMPQDCRQSHSYACKYPDVTFPNC